MQWQPQEQPLRQLAGFLQDSLSGYNPTAQKHAEQMLIQAYSNPDAANYLTFLFVNQTPHASLGCDAATYLTIRTSAAINLKNALRASYNSLPPEQQSYVRSSLLLAIQDPSSQIRNFAGNVMTEIVYQGGILAWPELIPQLLALAGNENGSVESYAQEGAIASLEKICEDNRKLLDKDYNGQRPLNVLIPKLLQLTQSDSVNVRAYSLSTIKIFLPQKPQAIMVNLDLLMERLFSLASDKSVQVRQVVCQLFSRIVDIRPDKVAPHIGDLVDYMILQQRNQDGDEQLALEAAEFWLMVGEHDQLRSKLGSHLQKIVPVLLESMVYSEDDIIRMEGERDDDAEEEDRAEDIRPQFAKQQGPRIAPVSGSTGNLTNGSGENAASKAESEMYEEDDDFSDGEVSEDKDGSDDNPEEVWNLRKCSAAALDVFATVFHDSVFSITLPYLEENLKQSEWPKREAAVLALGAIASGCMEMVMPHLPNLVPYLIQLLEDPEPVVRQITCWTLGRYSEWAAHLPDQPNRDVFFKPMMEGLLKKMLDGNKRVQEAAASAFANLEEKAAGTLIDYLSTILPQFVRCFQLYKERNMSILYDCVQTLAEQVGPNLAKPDYMNILMPALIHRWNVLPDDSRELFPHLECLGYVAQALCGYFSSYAGPVFARCVRIIHQNLEQYLACVNNPALEVPDKDFLVTSLDLLSAIIQAINSEQSAELVSQSQPNFYQLLSYCLEDPNNDVRQSGYALLGDCARQVHSTLRPFLTTIIPILVEQLDLDSLKDEDIESGFSVLNNACWACGEIAMKEGERMQPFIEKLYQRLITIIDNPEIPDAVKENVAIALGRLGVGNAEALAPHLHQFAPSFLISMSKVEYTDEKVNAFMGFNKTVEKNPQAMEDCLLQYFKAIALFPQESLLEYRDIEESFKEVLMGYRGLIPDYEGFLNRLPSPILTRLQNQYNLFQG